MNYKHKDTQIEFNADRATFVAMVKGKRLVAPSLDAIKKQIDAALAVTFEPFKAIDCGRGSMEEFQVTGVEKERRKYGAGRYWFLCRGDLWIRNRETVIIDTPENRKKVAAYQKRAKAIEAEKERLDAELEKMQEALPYVKAEDYAAGKSK